MSNKYQTEAHLQEWFSKIPPKWTAVGMCLINAFIKPTITLSNKNEKPERRRFAALCEFMTELTAAPFCFIVPSTCEKIAENAIKKIAAHKSKVVDETELRAAKNLASIVGIAVADVIIPAVARVFVTIANKRLNKSKCEKNTPADKPNAKKLDLSFSSKTNIADMGKPVIEKKSPLANSVKFSRNLSRQNLNSYKARNLRV